MAKTTLGHLCLPVKQEDDDDVEQGNSRVNNRCSILLNTYNQYTRLRLFNALLCVLFDASTLKNFDCYNNITNLQYNKLTIMTGVIITSNPILMKRITFFVVILWDQCTKTTTPYARLGYGLLINILFGLQ